MFSKKRISIVKNGDGGIITVKDCFLCPEVSYNYGSGAKIRISIVEERVSRHNRKDVWKVSLIDNDCQYILDSHYEHMWAHESKNLAQSLAKYIGCNMEMDFGGSPVVSIPYTYVGAPYNVLAKKISWFAPQEPVRPTECPVTIDDVSYGVGRRYTWGFTTSSMSITLVGYMFAIFVFGFLPIFDSRSFFVKALKSGNWSFFVGAAFLLFLMFAIWSSYRSIIEIYQQKISINDRLGGISYYYKSLPLDRLEMVFSRSTVLHNNLVLVFDDKIVYIKVDNDAIASYLASDIRKFLASGETNYEDLNNENSNEESGNMSDY
ncbi:MAG: hypothetical protein ACI38Q_01640 [Candidatus Bruticola sp.]